jgi:hypothetical protein
MNRFDELAKALAESATRRQALLAIGGGLLAALGLGTKAWAGNGWGEACQEYCKELEAHPLGQCVTACVACLKVGGNPCDVDQCCFGTEVCCGGECVSCPPFMVVDPFTCNCALEAHCVTDADCHPVGPCLGSGTCVHGFCDYPVLPNGTPCDDGNLCTQTDTCQSGVCVGGNPVVCTAVDQCHVAGTCNPATGACSNPAAADGTPCNTGNVCTPNDTCQAGMCVGGPAVC